MHTLSALLEAKIVAIIRGINPLDVLPIAQSLQQGGVRALEITLNSPNALQLIEKLSTSLGSQMLIGAGTVLDEASAKAAIDAGAKFIISPTLSLKTIRATKRYGVVSIPGAYTPTEILTAFEYGGDIIKVFPAASAVQYIKDVRGPLPQIPLMPTGGITKENIMQFYQAGAVAFGIGGALVNSNFKLSDQALQQLTDNARQFVSALSTQ